MYVCVCIHTHYAFEINTLYNIDTSSYSANNLSNTNNTNTANSQAHNNPSIREIAH